jgi:hypothetical protein
MPRLLVLVLLFAGGCAATGRPHTPGAADDFPPSEQVKSLTLPFDAYSPSLAALYTYSNAQDRKSSCGR